MADEVNPNAADAKKPSPKGQKKSKKDAGTLAAWTFPNRRDVFGLDEKR